ncbi:hypothetical protein [Candidatus Pelagibacter sp.]|uniref:hypothetical protein n=1 Tax=Candidatus Pelagibacter sp. TaxID=2024849 RepID=UPI003F852515
MKKLFFIIFFLITLLQSTSYSAGMLKYNKIKNAEEYLISIEITNETSIEVLTEWVLNYEIYNKELVGNIWFMPYKATFCGDDDLCKKEIDDRRSQINDTDKKAKMHPEYKAAVENSKKKVADENAKAKAEAKKAEDKKSNEKKVIEEIKNQIISLGGNPKLRNPGMSVDTYIKILISQKKAVEQKNIEEKIEKEKAAKKSKETLAERCKKEKERGTITMECAEYKDPSQMETVLKLKCNLDGKTFHTNSNVSITHQIEFKLYKSDGKKPKLTAFLDNTEVRPLNLLSRIGDADYSVGQRNENDPQTIFPGGFTFISFEAPMNMRPLNLDGGTDPVSIFFDVSLESAIKQKEGNFYMRSYLTKIDHEIPNKSGGTKLHPDFIQDNNCEIY